VTLGRVVGTVTATAKHAVLVSHKLLMVRPLDGKGQPRGSSLVALDMVQAGVGDTVLVMDEGNSARMIMADSSAPVRTVIVGIVDTVDRTQ
jgi:microcompartment protein CcmK/EutM